ncbi:MAG: hypothetical protein P1R58_09795 [bacterium]|nr:hypothetical protein [bacterium]
MPKPDYRRARLAELDAQTVSLLWVVSIEATRRPIFILMYTDSILSKTDQWWKLIWAASGLLLANCSFLLAILVRGNLRLLISIMLCGTIVSVASFLFACLAVKCPTCEAHWFWQAISRQKFNSWLLWLVKQPHCPNCHQKF